MKKFVKDTDKPPETGRKEGAEKVRLARLQRGLDAFHAIRQSLGEALLAANKGLEKRQ